MRAAIALTVLLATASCQREQAPTKAAGAEPKYYLFDKPLLVDSGLGAPDWRRELGMTQEQSDEATRLQRVDSNTYAQMMDAKLAGKPEAELGPYKERMREAERKILLLLDQKQKARLFQLQLQRRGLSYAAHYTSFVRDMGLTEAQLIEIAAINRIHRQIRSDARRRIESKKEAEWAAAFGTYPPEKAREVANAAGARSRRAHYDEEQGDLQAEAAEHMAVLTPAQREKWKKMLGPTYKEPYRPWGWQPKLQRTR